MFQNAEITERHTTRQERVPIGIVLRVPWDEIISAFFTVFQDFDFAKEDWYHWNLLRVNLKPRLNLL